MEGQATCNFVCPGSRLFEAGTFESKGWVFNRIEEIGALQVIVALIVACIDAGNVCGKVHYCIAKVIPGGSDLRGDTGESAVDLGDPQMVYPEVELRVGFIHGPGLGKACGRKKGDKCCCNECGFHFLCFYLFNRIINYIGRINYNSVSYMRKKIMVGFEYL
jgi:hypothetical protein